LIWTRSLCGAIDATLSMSPNAILPANPSADRCLSTIQPERANGHSDANVCDAIETYLLRQRLR